MTAKLNFKYKLYCKPTSVVVNEDGTVELEFNEEQQREWLMEDDETTLCPCMVGETQGDLLWELFEHDVSVQDENGVDVGIRDM